MSSCVVCLDRLAHSNPTPPECARGCRGSKAVCEECMCVLSNCVYCRERIRHVDPDPVLVCVGILAVLALFMDVIWISAMDEDALEGALDALD